MIYIRPAFIVSALALCIPHFAYATVTYPVTLTATNSFPSPPSTIPVGDTTYACYTLTNNSGSTAPLSITALSSPLTIASSPLTGCTGTGYPICTTSLTNSSTCTIEIAATPSSTQANQTFNQTLSVSYGGKKPLTAALSVQVANASANAALIAVGQSYDGAIAAQAPMIATGTPDSSNDTMDWSLPLLPTLATYATASAILNTGSCYDNFCVAGGENYGTPSAGYPTGPAILFQSNNYGAYWTTPTGGLGPDQAMVNASSCTTSGSPNIFCLVGGTNYNNLFLYYNATISSVTPGNWLQTGTNTNSPVINSISCSNKTATPSTTATCIAGGYDAVDNALLVHVRAGSTPTTTVLTNFKTLAQITSVSCTPNTAGTDVFCMVVGFTTAGRPAAYYDNTTTNDGNIATSWINTNLPSSWGSTTGKLNSVSCTTTSGRVFCAAGGSSSAPGNSSLLYPINVVAGIPVAPTNIPTTPPDSTINSVSCTAPDGITADTAICLANEASTNSSAAASKLWGISESNGTITNGYSTSPGWITATDVITNVTCTPAATAGETLCMVAGSTNNLGTGLPVLYYNQNTTLGALGTNWTTQGISIPGLGEFFGSAGTSTSQAIRPQIMLAKKSQ